jgi:hypothetical protein
LRKRKYSTHGRGQRPDSRILPGLGGVKGTRWRYVIEACAADFQADDGERLNPGHGGTLAVGLILPGRHSQAESVLWDGTTVLWHC